eukprot:m.205091 g.205091  ORF g.205091 m.205091 type:complete len:361 (+) comp22784_c0_seq1:221-1303(+)
MSVRQLVSFGVGMVVGVGATILIQAVAPMGGVRGMQGTWMGSRRMGNGATTPPPPPYWWDTLPSPQVSFDSNGYALYSATETLLRQPGFTEEVTVLKSGPVTYDWRQSGGMTHWALNNLHGGPEGKAPRWEPETFREFDTWVTRAKYYVGFGTWIGPTLLYGAQFVDKAVGFEADPDAYARVQANVVLNQHRKWGAHTRVYPVAVVRGTSDKPETVSMLSNQAGGSCSGVAVVGRTGCGNVTTRWKVQGFSLPTLLDMVDIPASKLTFIKIDVESFECELVSSWVPWLQPLGANKPTIRVAMHGPNVRFCTNEQYEQIAKVAQMYGAVWESERKVAPQKVTSTLFRSNSEFILTDLDDAS